MVVNSEDYDRTGGTSSAFLASLSIDASELIIQESHRDVSTSCTSRSTEERESTAVLELFPFLVTGARGAQACSSDDVMIT